MQLCPEAPGDHHHSDLCMSCTSSCAIPGTALLHVTSQGHTAWATRKGTVRKGSQIFHCGQNSLPKCFKRPFKQHLVAEMLAGHSPDTWGNSLWGMRSNICPTRNDMQGEVSVLRCVSAQLQMWKGMLTAVWAASPTSWHLTWKPNPLL